MQPINFELRDIDPDVVNAWRKYFRGVTNVSISLGDIFEGSADAIVSPANSFGYMDGGIDLVYLHRFGWELQTRLQTHLRDEHDGELPVGQATIIETFDPTIATGFPDVGPMLLGVGMCGIAWCMRPKPGRVPSQDIADRKNFPTLHAFVNEVAQQLGGQPINKIGRAHV